MAILNWDRCGWCTPSYGSGGENKNFQICSIVLWQVVRRDNFNHHQIRRYSITQINLLMANLSHERFFLKFISKFFSNPILIAKSIFLLYIHVNINQLILFFISEDELLGDTSLFLISKTLAWIFLWKNTFRMFKCNLISILF